MPLVTVEDNERLVTKREVKGARKVMDLFAQLGYPSVKDLVRMVKERKIDNLFVGRLSGPSLYSCGAEHSL